MTGDYSAGDLANLPDREGLVMTPAKIPLVLTRMEKRGKIEAVRRGSGRRASIFRKVAAAADQGAISANAAKDGVPFIVDAQAAQGTCADAVLGHISAIEDTLSAIAEMKSRLSRDADAARKTIPVNRPRADPVAKRDEGRII